MYGTLNIKATMVPLKFVCFVRSYPARGNLPSPTNDPQRAWRKRFDVQIFIEKGMANEKSDFLAKYARDFAPSLKARPQTCYV